MVWRKRRRAGEQYWDSRDINEEAGMTPSEEPKEKYHIQPYHMNGLNWTLVPDDPERDNVVVVTGFMPSWWEREYGISFRRDFHTNPKTHHATLAKMAALLRERFRDVGNFFFSPFDY